MNLLSLFFRIQYTSDHKVFFAETQRESPGDASANYPDTFHTQIKVRMHHLAPSTILVFIREEFCESERQIQPRTKILTQSGEINPAIN